MRRAAFALALLLLTAACGSGDDEEATPTTTTTTAPSTTTTTAAPTGPYAGTTNWICHPDRADDVCDDLRTTVVAPDGTRTVDDLAPAEDPDVDCFYVYPTTSTDPGANSDLEVDGSETSTVRAQVARYASACRVFAPAYRQVTLAGIFGAAGPEASDLAYADVLDAWETYVEHLSDGGRFVLVGHSQGAGHLRRLLTEEIAPDDELRARLVSAILLGTAVVEGSVPDVPACTSADEDGCVVTFASFPADSPPGEGSFFGRSREGGQALCVDPVALASDDGLADAVLPADGLLFGPVAEDLGPVDTPFVAFPDALRTSCEEGGGRAWLAIAPADPADPRPVARLLRMLPDASWGTHVSDANIAQDDLIALVRRQAAAAGAG